MAEQQRILCIDGNEDFRNTLSDQLTAEGFAVTAVASGAEGLTAAASSPFDLILLDTRLTEPLGLDVYQTLRAQPMTRHIPLILCTGDAPKDYWETLPYNTEGPCFVMGRSQDRDLLLARITQLLAEGTLTGQD